MTNTDAQTDTPAIPQMDPEEAARARKRRIEKIAKWLLPITVIIATLAYWQWYVTAYEVPHYLLPGPARIWQSLVSDFDLLMASWKITISIAAGALTIAVLGGVGLAVLFTQSRMVELSLFPYAVILQVTPIVAIAPLIFIWVEDLTLWLPFLGTFTIPATVFGLLICAWIVAFFPILSNTTLGLNSADHNLRDLFSVYGATRWQKLRYLQLPSALPYFLGGLRIAGGLSLIGAVVAEYVAGTGGIGSGLAFRILEAGYRLNIPRMFAALLLIAATGVLIFAMTSLLSHLLLHKWHESAVKQER